MNGSTRLPRDTSQNSHFEQSKQHLREFFQDKHVKNLISVLVPSALAAVLLPIFGPVAAGAAASVAIKNSLALLKIDMSTDTIEKLLKPIERKKMEDDDIQQSLTDTLQALLPTDKKVNEEAAKALVVVTPAIKDAALSNPKLDAEWLGTSLETNLKEQGQTMEKIAPDIHTLILKNGQALDADIQRLLQNWSRITVEVRATNESKISNVESNAKARGGQIEHGVTADNKSTIEGINIDSEIS